MKINDIYIGGWFQRTMLQLSEIYDFLRFGESHLNLSKSKLLALRDGLEIGQIEYGVSGEEYVKFTAGGGISVKIFEDGLITLKNSSVTSETLLNDVNKVQEYYENRLSPALNYLFSLGAPVPKELAGIKNVYPYFIVCANAPKKEMDDLLLKTEGQKYFEFENEKYDVMRGDKYYFINNKKRSNDEIERYIEEQIFIREFKGQLHRYLNIHRTVWEKIDEIKEQKNVRGEDILKFSTKLEAYAKTINLIDGRIKQMSTYLPTRERIAKEDKDLTEFLEISGYRYETLKDTLNYIQNLWTMTQNYVVAAQKKFESIKSEVTSKSVDKLTIITSMSAGAGIIGLFQKTEPKLTTFGVAYFFILALIGWAVNRVMKRAGRRQKYDVTDVEYDKNIK